MIKNIIKKLFLGITLAGVVTFTAAASACKIETDHPNVRITVEFNSEQYVLNYSLYRNMYPNTVRHFIELADAGFYNDMLVHNYTSQDWYTGGYAYDAEKFESYKSSENFTEYYSATSNEEKYMDLFNAGKLTSTVYSNVEKDKKDNDVVVAEYALPTLIGEFYNNVHQVIEKGEIKEDYGTLKMYYYSKSSKGKLYVTPTADQIIPNADYKYNSATSLFTMQVTASSGLGYQYYAVFAKITNASPLDDLVDDVKAVLGEYGDSINNDQTYSVTTTVDNHVEVYSQEVSDRGINQTFHLPKTPIIIRSVKVTKY